MTATRAFLCEAGGTLRANDPIIVALPPLLESELPAASSELDLDLPLWLVAAQETS